MYLILIDASRSLVNSNCLLVCVPVTNKINNICDMNSRPYYVVRKLLAQSSHVSCDDLMAANKIEYARIYSSNIISVMYPTLRDSQ